MNKIEAHKNASNALDNLQNFTKEQYPVGTAVFSRRGRGIAAFKVSGFPNPTSLETANSVIGTSENGKEQVLTIASLVNEDEKKEAEARKEQAKERANERAKELRREMRKAWEEKKAAEAPSEDSEATVETSESGEEGED